MKRAKKLLVTLLVLTFVLSSFSVGLAADTEEKLPSEVVRAQALGILEGDDQGNLNLDKPITRAEALALVVRISGLRSSADLMKGQTQFADVNPDPALQWATGYINLGVGQKIINGYPDGTFRGKDQVTYAEMAKMLLYAMNYGVTVEGATWPAGVMGKADDLELFDKVNALPDIPALRGDVVKMIDNSLTVNHLKQTGYGDFKQYEEDEGKTFLSKMNVDELKDVRVTEIAKVNDKFDDDEIELTEYDKNGKIVDSDIYTLIADVNPEEIFGLEVDTWVNDDDEVFFVKVKTAEKDILLDTVDAGCDDKEITLKDADKTYKWDEDAVAYVNFEEVDFEDIDENAYGKVVLDRGRVAFANLFEFDHAGVVTEIDENIIEFIEKDDERTSEDEIDLDDYDDVYVYNPDFSKADVDDIDEDSAIFFWEGDDDDIYIIVKNETVKKGEVERVKEDKIKVNGKEYSKGSYAIFTLDKGDNYEVWADLDDVKDFVDEEVMLVLDLRGRVLLVTGSAKATSSNLYGIVTYAKDGRYADLTVFTDEGEEVDYTAESSTEFRDLAALEYYRKVDDEPKLSYAALKYKLTSDSEIAEEKSVVAVIEGEKFKESFAYDEDVKDTDKVVFKGKLTKKSDKKYVDLDDDEKFYITNDTVIMKALNDKGELDPETISVDRFISINIGNEDSNEAVVFGKDGKDADFIVMLEKGFEGTEEDYLYGVVTDKPSKSGGSYYATINVFGEGEKDYKIDDAKNFKKGKVVAFDFNNKDEAVLKLKDRVFEGTITKYDDGYITVSGEAYGTYKVDSAAILYNKDSDDALDKKISRSKLKDYKDKVIDFAIEDEILVAAVVYDGKKAPDVKIAETKLISAVEGDTAGEVVVKYDVKKDDTVELRLYNANTDKIVDFVPSAKAKENEKEKTVKLEAKVNGIHYVRLYVDGKEVGSKLVKVTNFVTP